MFIRYIALICLFISAEPSNAEFFRITNFGIDVKINGKEAYFDVVETIEVSFNQERHGIIRTIPTRFRKDGKDGEIKISSIQVFGHPYKVQNGSTIFIKIGSADTFVSGKQTYIIRYRVDKAWLFEDDHTEFYWNLTGNKWDVEIDSVHWNISLGGTPPMTDQDYLIYTGIYGSKEKNAVNTYYMGDFTGHTTAKLLPRQGVTVAINLPMDFIKRPSIWQQRWEKYGMMGLAGLIFTILVSIFYGVWRRFGKDYPIVKMVQFSPPKDVTPAEAGLIIDAKADSIDLLAMIPYWASNGYLTIKRIASTSGSDDHELTKIKDLDSEAKPYELTIFKKLFEGANTVKVSSLKYEFADTMQASRSMLQSQLHQMDIYYPVSIRKQTTMYILSVLMIILGILTSIFFKTIWLALGFGLASLLGLFFAYHMLKRNEKGVHLYQHIIGFKTFVKEADKERIERLLQEDPMYFEKTLPYAMLFGYAKVWSNKFDGLLVEPPKWYSDPYIYRSGHFHMGDFGKSVDESINDIGAVFSSVPEPKGNFGGQNYGGGGFSGGGFGGGGGSSW